MDKLFSYYRVIVFTKHTTAQYIVDEYLDNVRVDNRTMTPEQVGKRESELIREGFRVYTDAMRRRVYVK